MNPDNLSGLSEEQRVQVWREAVAHLRYLNDEVWKRFQFFLAVDVALLGAAVFALQQRETGGPTVSALLASIAGIILTVNARYILKRNRIYYLQMLLKKTLIENDCGFYQLKLSGTDTDLAVPWRLTPEVIEKLKKTPDQWIEENIAAPKTIARRLFRIYTGAIVLFVITIVLSLT